MQNRYFRILFILGLSLRLFLAFYNRSANDDHVGVISIILKEGRVPERNECWSCYQPKLFYIINAVIDKVLAIESQDNWILIAQLLNVFVVAFALYCIGNFIHNKVQNQKLKYAIWALVIFNPCFTGISIQGTNDTFVISFGILAYYFYDQYVQKLTQRYFYYTLLFVLLAIWSKASGWIVAGTIVMHYCYLLFSGYIKLFEVKWNLVVSALGLVLMVYIGGYWTNWTKHNSDSLSTWNKAPAAKFFEIDSYGGRPGVLSLWDAFFSFRYVDMIQQPYINNDLDGYPLHRTSHWSQLYGRTFFAHFDQWPPAWQSQHRNIVFAGRVLLTLAILPLILFLSGIYQSLKTGLLALKNKTLNTYLVTEGIFIIGTIAFLAASVKYSMDYRDFSAMKSIYIFPGLLLYIYLLIRGVNQIKVNWLQRGVLVVLWILVLFSIYDVLFLAQQLYS
ncbi:MAG: glycosyltransferase family 39 protein [Cytophagaceae bacterium]